MNSDKESRTQRLKQRVLEAPYTLCIERARYVTEAYRQTEGMHPSLRAARALENTLSKKTVFILEEEKIAGNLTSALVGTLLPVERGDINLILEIDLDNLMSRKIKPYVISPGDKRELLEDIIPYWKGKSVRDGKYRLWRRQGLYSIPSLSLPSIIERTQNFGIEHLGGIVKKFVSGRERHALKTLFQVPINNPNLVNNVFDIQGHLIVGHNRVMPVGFKGIRDLALERLKANPPEDKARFLESVVVCCEAAKMFAERFSALARDLAVKEQDPARRQELMTMAKNADRVPWLGPRGFHEAVQFLWFTQAMAAISYGIGICAIGRPDQYLFPYFIKDLEAGNIDEAGALQLLEELLIKLSVNLIPLPSYAKDTASELGADSMAITLGGLGPDGNDATNRLSFLFLDAIRNLKGMSNSYSIRLSPRTPKEFRDKVSEVHAVTSGLALFNDEVIVKALENCGCSREDALDYGIVGCVEPTSQGDTFGCTSGNDISLVGVLEMTLLNGELRIMGRRTGLRTGDPAAFKTFDEFMEAFRRQLGFAVREMARRINAKDRVYALGFHNPFISMTLEGCLDNAEDMTRGGAKYNFSSIVGRGLGTTADSLSALKKFVFEEHRVPMKELLRALRTNFRGRETLRKVLETRTPRYGADNPEADKMAGDVAAMFCGEVMKRKLWRGRGMFRPGFFSYGMHVHDGSFLGATPDGRLAGRPVSNSLSPTNGAEVKGPTAVFRSAAAIDHAIISNGSSLNMKLLPALLQTYEGRAKFQAMIQAYFGMGGMHVQFNVVDNRVLRQAQLRPQEFGDLIVRVSGYSAYFIDLGKSIQDDIIRRTEFGGF